MTRGGGSSDPGRRRRPADAAVSRPLPDGSTFLRGLWIGALVGAAIAGSAIWQRRRDRQPAGPPGPAAVAARDVPTMEAPET